MVSFKTNHHKIHTGAVSKPITTNSIQGQFQNPSSQNPTSMIKQEPIIAVKIKNKVSERKNKNKITTTTVKQITTRKRSHVTDVADLL